MSTSLRLGASRVRPVQTLVFGLAICACAVALGQPPQAPPPEVSIVPVTSDAVPVSLDYVGVTQASRTVEIRSRIRGFLEARSFEEGAYVEEGAELFTIDPRSFQADLEIAQARVEQSETGVKLAAQEVARLQSVEVPGAIAQSDLDQRLAEQADAAAALNLAKAQLKKAQLELSYTTVEAPLTGYIGKALMEIGSFVDESMNSLLAEMYQVDPIYVSFQMSEREYLRWRGQLATGDLIPAESGPYVEITLLDGTVYAERGSITFESVEVDLSTGTVELRASFANPDQRLKPGQFVTAHLKGYLRPNTIAVPQRAVSQSPQGAYVYVVGPDNKAELRHVTPGDWVGQSWVIESGLEVGEHVVVEGLVKVQPGITVRSVPWQPKDAAAAQ